MQIDGVPESIPRERVRELVEAMGFDLKDLMECTVRHDTVVARVRARDMDGRAYLDEPGGEVAIHSIYIPVVDA